MTPKQMEVSLKEYIDTRIKALEDRFTGVDHLQDVARQMIEQRRESVEEQARHFLPREESDQRWASHLLVTDGLEKRIGAVEVGKLSVSDHNALEARIQALEKEVSNILGRFWAFAIGLTLLAIIVSVIIKFI